MTRTELVSHIKQYIKFNRNQEIDGDTLQSVLLTMLTDLRLLSEGTDNIVIQYSQDYNNWDNPSSLGAISTFWRFSDDGGETFAMPMYTTFGIKNLLLGDAPTEGNTLGKLHTRLTLSETAISNLQSAIDVSPDDLQDLQDLLTMLENNPTTVGEALSNKLETSVYNAFIAQYGLDLLGKASAEHLHDMDDVNGLSSALEGKASKVHEHTAAEFAAWGITLSSDLSFGRF